MLDRYPVILTRPVKCCDLAKKFETSIRLGRRRSMILWLVLLVMATLLGYGNHPARKKARHTSWTTSTLSSGDLDRPQLRGLACGLGTAIRMDARQTSRNQRATRISGHP